MNTPKNKISINFLLHFWCHSKYTYLIYKSFEQGNSALSISCQKNSISQIHFSKHFYNCNEDLRKLIRTCVFFKWKWSLKLGLSLKLRHLLKYPCISLQDWEFYLMICLINFHWPQFTKIKVNSNPMGELVTSNNA